MVMSGSFPAAAFGACVLLSACSTNNLYIAHDTVVGLNASVDSQRGSGQLIVGYDRNFGTYVPKSVRDGDGQEAMSVLSCSKLKVRGIWLTEFTEYLGTGEAAAIYADNLAEKKTTAFTCIQ